MPRPLLFCLKSGRSVCYSVPDNTLHRTGEMKQWEGKEIANIMNNAIEGWKPHGTHRFGKEYGIQRSWKRMEDSVKKDKDGFMEVPEQLEIPFE